ncbi:CLUMA_CG006817, isoform A [Clunio marinus]|uniref:CLUMA_CG006817, isoform A n=1 Tax=Clunio marinus TaxID=568069 RepID=A0A1J1I0G7_9DIPT|nr:CLUMA_CG006817, isoform A [Clunio marinus]
MFNLETARRILIDILKHVALPENSKRISEAKSNSGREMIKMMQFVFPIIMELQMEVIKNYGFSGREGLVQFEQLIRDMEADEEIARLRQQIRNIYLPPMNSASSPDLISIIYKIMENIQNIKCVTIGSKAVGKTSLLNTFAVGPQSADEPFENFNGIKIKLEVDGEIFQLELWDTNCESHNKMIRKVYYNKCNVIILCFSVMDHESFMDVKKKWQSEVEYCCPAVPLLLVGTKSDLRHDRVSLLRLDRIKNQKPITIENAKKMSRKISAASYLECSAINGNMTCDGVDCW